MNTLRKALKHLKRSATTDFEYVDRGTVCSLGAHDGVGIVYGRDITGKSCIHEKSYRYSCSIQNRWRRLSIQKGKF